MSGSIREIIEIGKRLPEILGRSHVFIPLVIILVAFSSFGLGRLSKLEQTKSPVRIETAASANAAQASASADPSAQAGAYVASRNGTAYYFPWCSGVSRIKEENKVWFATKEDAAQAGYRPAKNCQGL